MSPETDFLHAGIKPCKSCYNKSMGSLFIIKANDPQDLFLYEQVFSEAGFRLVAGGNEDDLLLCDGALLYGNEDTARDEACATLISFCLRRNIPLLILHDSGLFPQLKEEKGVYDAACLSMKQWKTVLYPPKEPEKETPEAVRRFLNLMLFLLCAVPLVLFSYRIYQVSSANENTAPAVEETGDMYLDTYGVSAAQVYSISSFGDEVYRGSGYAVSDDGYILTCAHVVDHPSSMYRIVYHLQVLPAELVARDSEKDLALLKVGTATKAMKLADGEPSAGENIWLIGWPENSSRTLLEGSYDGRVFNGLKVIHLPMSQGVSGSCVINGKGEVIGTAAAMDSNDHTTGLIVPLEDITEFLKDHIVLNRGQ